MATTPIRAVVFDMGGTLEDLYYDDAIRQAATRGLSELLRGLDLDPGLSLPDLHARVLSGMEAYQEWRERTEVELPPEKVWSHYVFPDHGLSKERLTAAAEEITFFYETHYQVRSLRPEAATALNLLHRKNYRLAVISNIISRQLVQRKLAEYGIGHYFDPVVTSSNFGRRKPNASIFVEAAHRMLLPPFACAYVGDTISRDVIGARRAGYGLAIQIRSFLTSTADRSAAWLGRETGDTARPDAVVHDLVEVVGLVDGENPTLWRSRRENL